eukprot:1157510-Pelagomonas_calceolata.AAC.22
MGNPDSPWLIFADSPWLTVDAIVWMARYLVLLNTRACALQGQLDLCPLSFLSLQLVATKVLYQLAISSSPLSLTVPYIALTPAVSQERKGKGRKGKERAGRGRKGR